MVNKTSPNREQLLRQAVEFFKSELWIELIRKEKMEKLQSLRNRLELFETGRDEYDDFVRGQIEEIKTDFKLKDFYEKELDELTMKK